ncbi:MAG TPA: hypothetical protein VF696_00960 [Candidatus Paceibacterota bacterium]|jgi:hypothetical protein
MYKFIVSLSALALIVALASGAQAQNASVGTSINREGTSPLDTSVDTVVEGDGGASADTGVSSDTGASASGGAAGTLSLTQEQAAATSLDAESAELSAGSVINSQDLSLYVTSVMKRDVKIEEIHADGEHVSITYTLPARFLAVIPTSLTAEATVTADGKIDLDYPWYRFLFAVENGDDIEARLEGGVREQLARVGTNGSFSAAAEAGLIAAIHAALSGRVDTNAGTVTDDMMGTSADLSGSGAGDASATTSGESAGGVGTE